MKKLLSIIAALCIAFSFGSGFALENYEANRTNGFIYLLPNGYNLANETEENGVLVKNYYSHEGRITLIESIADYPYGDVLVTDQGMENGLRNVLKDIEEDSICTYADGNKGNGSARGKNGGQMCSCIVAIENQKMIVLMFLGKEHLDDDELKAIRQSIQQVDDEKFNVEVLEIAMLVFENRFKEEDGIILKTSYDEENKEAHFKFVMLNIDRNYLNTKAGKQFKEQMKDEFADQFYPVIKDNFEGNNIEGLSMIVELATSDGQTITMSKDGKVIK